MSRPRSSVPRRFLVEPSWVPGGWFKLVIEGILNWIVRTDHGSEKGRTKREMMIRPSHGSPVFEKLLNLVEERDVGPQDWLFWPKSSLSFCHRLLHADSRVDDGVEQVHNQVDNDKDRGHQQSPTLDDHIVSLDHTIKQPLALLQARQIPFRSEWLRPEECRTGDPPRSPRESIRF